MSCAEKIKYLKILRVKEDMIIVVYKCIIDTNTPPHLTSPHLTSNQLDLQNLEFWFVPM